MTLQQLRHFDAMARTGNMRRAAEAMFISEPSLSMSISKLEKELNIPLLERTGRTARLTEAGWTLEEHAKRILREADEAERHMRALSEQGASRIRLGYVTPLARRYVPEQMRAFLDRKGNESTVFEVESGATGDLVRMLQSGLYDMVLCSDPGEDPALVKRPLMEQPILLLSPNGHPREVQTLKELEDLPLIGYPRQGAMDTYLSALQGREKFTLRFVCRAPDEVAIAALVVRNLGCAVVAEVDGLEEFSLHRQLLPGDHTRTIFLVTLRDRTLTGAARRFERFLQGQN